MNKFRALLVALVVTAGMLAGAAPASADGLGPHVVPIGPGPVGISPVIPASFSCVDQATGRDSGAYWIGDTWWSYTKWMTSSHKCVDGTGKSGAIFVSNIHGGSQCATGKVIDVMIMYTTGVTGSRVRMKCGDTTSYQMGVEKSLTGPQFRFMVTDVADKANINFGWTSGTASS